MTTQAGTWGLRVRTRTYLRCPFAVAMDRGSCPALHGGARPYLGVLGQAAGGCLGHGKRARPIYPMPLATNAVRVGLRLTATHRFMHGMRTRRLPGRAGRGWHPLLALWGLRGCQGALAGATVFLGVSPDGVLNDVPCFFPRAAIRRQTQCLRVHYDCQVVINGYVAANAAGRGPRPLPRSRQPQTCMLGDLQRENTGT